MKFLTAVVGSMLAVGMAWGDEHTHDGFFLNLGLGLGSTDMDFVVDDADLEGTMSGSSTLLDVRIGGCPVNNLAVSFDLSGITMDDPDLEVDGETGSVDGSINISAMGLGVTWFKEDWNAYVGSSLYFMGQENVDQEVQSGAIKGSLKGFALRVGKEWWISDNWGLGAQLQYNMTSFDADTDPEETNDFSTLGLLFSATFN